MNKLISICIPTYNQQFTFHLDMSKLRSLGFSPKVSVIDGFSRIMQIEQLEAYT